MIASAARDRRWAMQGGAARVTPGATPRCRGAAWRVRSPRAADGALRSVTRRRAVARSPAAETTLGRPPRLRREVQLDRRISFHGVGALVAERRSIGRM